MNLRLPAVVASIAGLLVLLAPLPALAQSQSSGLLRIAYFSPDGPNVDVYIDGNRTLANLVYKSVGNYRQVPVGSHKFDIRAASSDPTSPPLATVNATIASGAYYTVAVAGKAAQLTAVLFTDGFTPPALGKTELRAFHFAPEVPAVDIAIKGGPVIFSSVGFPEATSYLSVTSGTYDLEFRAAGTDQVLLTARGVTIRAGEVESLVGVGGVGRPVEVVQIEDAAGAPASGGASSGLGGMAHPGMPNLVHLGVVFGLIGAVLWLRRREVV